MPPVLSSLPTYLTRAEPALWKLLVIGEWRKGYIYSIPLDLYVGGEYSSRLRCLLMPLDSEEITHLGDIFQITTLSVSIACEVTLRGWTAA